MGTRPDVHKYLIYGQFLDGTTRATQPGTLSSGANRSSVRQKERAMRRNRLVAAIVGAALTLSLAVSANAGVIFNPDGAGPAPIIDVGSLDWGPTSFLALGGVTAISNFLATG